MLYLIGKKYDSKNIELYRDDRLAALKNVRRPASEKIKKHLQYLFKQKSLQMIIECNFKVVNYLDVTFNLIDGSYRPYRKPNDETHYIHIQSDHPPSITKQLPRSIEKRNYHHQKIYFTKWHHILSNVSPAVDITEN